MSGELWACCSHRMQRFEPHQLTREAIDDWPIAKSGLNARVVHCLEQTGVKTIGQLRGWDDPQLLNLANFGSTSLENVRWFFNWTHRLEAGNARSPVFACCCGNFSTPRKSSSWNNATG